MEAVMSEHTQHEEHLELLDAMEIGIDLSEYQRLVESLVNESA